MAKIAKLTCNLKGDAIKFDELMFEAKDNGTLTEMLRHNAPVLLTISLDGEQSIQSSGTLTKSEVNVTNQNPKFTGLRFSPGQCEKLIRLMRSEADITVTIEQSQGELDLDGEPTE